MAKIPAPSAKMLLLQATALWSNRRTDSDGIVPSAAHTAANPTSDHEPGAAGYCHAVDLSHDPANGCDCAAITEKLRASRDPRIKYVIFNRRIFSPSTWEWRPYSGSNPHDKHLHMSIIDTKLACEDLSPWEIGGTSMGIPLTIGSTGALVGEVQERLRITGADMSRVRGNLYDSVTAQLVRNFQSSAGLPVTGVVDKATYDKLVAITTPAPSYTSTDTNERIATLEAQLDKAAEHARAILALIQ